MPRLPRRVVVALALTGAAVIIAGCSSTQRGGTVPISLPYLLNPRGPIALREANLFWFILIVATVVFVSVTGTLIWSIIRFHARPGMPAPRQTHGNTPLEIAWTIVPSVILFMVLGVTISTMFALAQPADPNTITITAVGHQWWWEFDYPNDHIVTADEMHIPVGTVVHIDLRSNNVIHSFWVPSLGGKTDVIPGHDNAMWLKADTAGIYRGECAEFCGTQHAHMDFIVVAQSPGDYLAWLNGQQAAAATPTSGLALAGYNYFKSSPCVGCHVVNGVDNNPSAIGPNLTHFGSRMLIAGGVLDNTPGNLRQWINNAQAVKPGVDMPTFAGQLTPQQLDALVAYLESLQ